jgi:hypothetical protein
MDRWLARLRHDLVKQALWRARDLRDLDGEPGDADLAALRRGLLDLRDLDGKPASALEVWRAFRAEVEAPERRAPLDAFERAVAEAEHAVRALDGPHALPAALAKVLHLEGALATLARALEFE